LVEKMRAPLRRRAAALAFAALSVAAASSAAEPSDADKATARALMNEGYDALERGDVRMALERFRAADALVHVPTTTFALARAEVADGRLVEAHEALVGLSRIPVKGGEPREFTTARQEGDRLLLSLEGRIPSVRLAINGGSSADDTRVIFDGEPLPLAAIRMARKVDPGPHTIIVERAGETKQLTLQVEERENKVVEVVFTTPSPVAPAGQEIGPRSTPLTVVGVVGACVGLAAGATMGGLALAAKESATNNGATAGECPPSAQSDCHRAKAFAAASTVSFGIAGVGAAVAAVSYLWLTPQRAKRVAGLEPYVGLGSAGLWARF
jgi:hypothetical protein